MERPLGPRVRPPGDRNRAFESIFGRPSAVHHLPQAQNHAYLQGPGPHPNAPLPPGFSHFHQPQYPQQYLPLTRPPHTRASSLPVSSSTTESIPTILPTFSPKCA
ncbi:hypothetical protein BS47DRAFT_119919 [Hydnum rufescens UP504]|uniref:Uncharacterized protein n=1 Tax=Hydnum rufescens UP504 TaxID=1448309 RepID=A0A9P6B7M4_9AGAM|nr:hypothetical protein BS47DRAFT_119919 [Hydnum rufescens UP504]